MCIRDRLWPHLLCPYTQSIDVYNCPSARASAGTFAAWDGRYTGAVSYGYNWHVGGSSPLSSNISRLVGLNWKSDSAIQNPAGMIMFADNDDYVCCHAKYTSSGASYFCRLFTASTAGIPCPYHTSQAYLDTPARHNEQHNITFVDGHVKTMRLSAFGMDYQMWDSV